MFYIVVFSLLLLNDTNEQSGFILYCSSGSTIQPVS